MSAKLVFWTAFNSYRSSKCLRGLPKRAAHPVTTEAWTKRRAQLFAHFNLPSIMSQTWTDWLYVVLLDPELRCLTDRLLPKPADARVIYAYEDGPALEALRRYDEVALTLIDSDDMYARTAGAHVMACGAVWSYFKLGYALEERSGRLWHYDTIGTGPFFARRIDPKRIERFDRDKRHPTHVAVENLKPRRLAPGQFVVLLHNVNTSSTPGMRYVIKRPVSPRILAREFGVQWRRP